MGCCKPDGKDCCCCCCSWGWGRFRSWMLWDGGCFAEGPDSKYTWFVPIFWPLKLLLTTIRCLGWSSTFSVLFFRLRSRNETKYVLSGSSFDALLAFVAIGSIGRVFLIAKPFEMRENFYSPKMSRTFEARSEMLSTRTSICLSALPSPLSPSTFSVTAHLWKVCPGDYKKSISGPDNT